MGLAEGTNCGFVLAAPTGDPAATAVIADSYSQACKFVAPANAVKVTEIGWYCGNATEAANFEVAIYAHNVGDDNPEAIVGVSRTNAKGTSSGWKKAAGLDIAITGGTTYWIAQQLDNTATSTQGDVEADASSKRDRRSGQATLADPWGVTGDTFGQKLAVYALYEESSPGGEKSAGVLRKDSLAGKDVPGLFE
jgi:hypothetical protein